MRLPHLSSQVSGFPVASPCLWGKLQNISFSKVSKQVVMSFCVAGVELYTLHSALYTPHCTLYTPHSTLSTPHFTLYALDSTHHTLHSSLRAPHSTLHTPHSTLHTPHPTLYTFHSTRQTGNRGNIYNTVQVSYCRKVFCVTAYPCVSTSVPY